MAEIWANRLMLPDWEIRSAAWTQSPQSSFNEIPLEVMKEVILDLPPVEPRKYNSEEVSEADLIIALHDGELEHGDIPTDLPSQNYCDGTFATPSCAVATALNNGHFIRKFATKSL